MQIRYLRLQQCEELDENPADALYGYKEVDQCI